MKSLEERKKFRAEQRAAVLGESANVSVDLTGGEKSAFADMTIDQLKATAKELGAEVPKEKTKLAEIREFVENLAAFKAKQDEEEGGGAGWNKGN